MKADTVLNYCRAIVRKRAIISTTHFFNKRIIDFAPAFAKDSVARALADPDGSVRNSGLTLLESILQVNFTLWMTR